MTGSNISSRTPKGQYFSLPPNSKTKPHHSHGIHYIKLFPIEDRYVQSYLINEPFDILVKKIIDNNEFVIIQSCQNYLKKYESGNYNIIQILHPYNTLLISSPFTGERHLCSSSFMAIIFSFFSVTTPITAASTPFCPK